jgi:hypothetical protein
MNMPGFTGDASLYRTKRHYLTGRNRQAIHLPAPTIETIHPAREEVIEVHSCPPGYNDWGGTCYPVLTEPPWGGGGGGPGTSGESSGDKPPSGGGGGSPAPIPTPTRPPRNYHPTPFGKCHVRGTIDKGLYLYDPAKGNWECCRQATGGTGLTCVVCEENSVGNLCRDGHR